MNMRLHHGALSPFVRKVMICVHEKGIADQIEIVPTKVGAGVINDDLMTINPIGKIPTLVGADGQGVYDSLVIIDYLDQIFPERPMIPAAGPDRTAALRVNAIADGLLVAGVLAKGEAARPAERQWPEWKAAQWAKVVACIKALETHIETDKPINIGHAAAAAALGWLDVRAPEENWRESSPRLAGWFAEASGRPSLQSTMPKV